MVPRHETFWQAAVFPAQFRWPPPPAPRRDAGDDVVVWQWCRRRMAARCTSTSHPPPRPRGGQPRAGGSLAGLPLRHTGRPAMQGQQGMLRPFYLTAASSASAADGLPAGQDGSCDHSSSSARSDLCWPDNARSRSSPPSALSAEHFCTSGLPSGAHQQPAGTPAGFEKCSHAGVFL